jgi:hypothetical protein
VSEPTRWLKDGRAPREVVEMLESMAPPKPASPAVHHKLAARFADAGSARAAFGWPLGAKLARLVAGVAIGGGVVFAAARASLVRKAPTDVRESAPAAAAPAVPAPKTAGDPAAAANPALPTEPAPVEATPPPSRPAVASPSRRAASSNTDTLAEEESILEDARRALITSPARALRFLAAHQRRFPAGELTAERLFLRTDALRRLGRTGDAKRQADALVKLFPNSAYARLVPDLLAAPAP